MVACLTLFCCSTRRPLNTNNAEFSLYFKDTKRGKFDMPLEDDEEDLEKGKEPNQEVCEVIHI